MSKKKNSKAAAKPIEPVVEPVVMTDENAGLSFLVMVKRSQTPIEFPQLIIQGVDTEQEAIRMFLNENGLWSQGDLMIEALLVDDDFLADNEAQKK